jgi:hypothetical protein
MVKESLPIIFKPDSRKALNKLLKSIEETNHTVGNGEKKQLSGTLRALHLDKDWIEISIPENKEPIRIFQTGDVIDDIVGPMVNQRVLVDVLLDTDGKHFFQDIQSDE